MPFVKGKSGNPGGRPKGVAEVRELARKYTPNVIRRLAKISKQGDTDAARVAACRELLDRAWGKSTQKIEGELAITEMTDEQLAKRFAEITGLRPPGGAGQEGAVTTSGVEPPASPNNEGDE